MRALGSSETYLRGPVFPILSFIYSRPCFSWKKHPSLLQLSCPAHRFKQKRENVSEDKESSGKPGVRRTGWMVQEMMFSPSTIGLGGWTFEAKGWSLKLRQKKAPSFAYEPCRGCLEVSGCGSASPGVCVKGTRKLSREDGSEQTCSGVGVRRSAVRAAPRLARTWLPHIPRHTSFHPLPPPPTPYLFF